MTVPQPPDEHNQFSALPTGPGVPGRAPGAPDVPCHGQAMLPPVPGEETGAFQVQCPRCETAFSLPFDPVHSAILDRLLCLDEHVQALTSALEEVLP